jgi:hypothetical protein
MRSNSDELEAGGSIRSSNLEASGFITLRVLYCYWLLKQIDSGEAEVLETTDDLVRYVIGWVRGTSATLSESKLAWAAERWRNHATAFPPPTSFIALPARPPLRVMTFASNGLAWMRVATYCVRGCDELRLVLHSPLPSA